VMDSETVKLSGSQGLSSPNSGKPDDSSTRHGEEMLAGSDTVESGKQRTRRKGGKVQGKTAKLFNDITLIDVAMVNSCVERDYSEFIKSIEETPGNKKAVSDSRRRKKTVLRSGNNKKTLSSSVVSEADDDKEQRSKRSRSRRKDDVSTVCAEQSVNRKEQSRNKKKKLPQDNMVDESADKRTKVSHSVGNSAATSESLAAPNCRRTAARPRRRRNKQRESLLDVETETQPHHRATTSTLEASQVPETDDKKTEDQATKNNEAMSHSSQVNCAANRKKNRSSRRKPAALLDVPDPGDGYCSTATSEVGTKTRKRKLQTSVSSHMTSDKFSEPAVKHCKKTVSTSNSAFDAVDTGDESVVTGSSEMAREQTEVLEPAAENRDITLAQTRDELRKKKKKKTKLSVGDETRKMIRDDVKTGDEDSEARTHSDDAVINSDNNGQSETTPCCDGTVTSVEATAGNDEVKSTELPAVSSVDDMSRAPVVTGQDTDEAIDMKLFACTQCNYRARKKGQLRKHLSVHKVYSCAHCEFTADTQGGLDQHMSVSHPSRCGRRLCKRCHMLFRAGGAFAQHVEQCSGEKLAWQCPTCSKNFKFVSAMRTHVRRWHSGGDDNTTEHSAAVDDAQLTSESVCDESSVCLPLPVNTADGPDGSTLSVLCSSTVPDNSTLPSQSAEHINSLWTGETTCPAVSVSVTPPSLTVCDTMNIPVDTAQLSALSAVDIGGDVRYICSLCPKSFKAKRSMVHHRRMIHEGGRLRKKLAAVERLKVNEENVTPAGNTDDPMTSLQSYSAAPVEMDGSTSVSAPATRSASSAPPAGSTSSVLTASSASSAPAAGSARVVYSCSFSGCCQTFKRVEQLHRHEERHAGPGNLHCHSVLQLVTVLYHVSRMIIDIWRALSGICPLIYLGYVHCFDSAYSTVTRQFCIPYCILLSF